MLFIECNLIATSLQTILSAFSSVSVSATVFWNFTLHTVAKAPVAHAVAGYQGLLEEVAVDTVRVLSVIVLVCLRIEAISGRRDMWHVYRHNERRRTHCLHEKLIRRSKGKSRKCSRKYRRKCGVVKKKHPRKCQ